MGIRANTGNVTIDVNDNGDTISFSISDNKFLAAFSDFSQWFFDNQNEISKLDKEIKQTPEDKNGIEKFNLLLAAQEGLSKQVLAKLDELFGNDTSEKIFGDISPVFVCVVDVVYQLVEEIDRIMSEHNQHLSSRYNRNRKGARA